MVVGVQCCVLFVETWPVSGLDRMTMCDMNRVVGAHASPFPFPITPERRAPASSLSFPFVDAAVFTADLTEL